MEKFLSDTVAASSISELVALFDAEINRAGFKYYAYHVVARDFRKQDLRSSLRCHHVPDGWLERYMTKGYIRIDPIQFAAAQRSAPFYWDEIRATGVLVETQSEFFLALSDSGFGAGISVPVFSRPGTIAYFCFGSARDELLLSPLEIARLQVICNFMHGRFEQLSESGPCPKLSQRETEVLTLLAAGRSNAEIARHLEISIHTVDTLVKRCFIKLNAKSRLEAGLSAAARGIAMLAAPCHLNEDQDCLCYLSDWQAASPSRAAERNLVNATALGETPKESGDGRAGRLSIAAKAGR